MKDEKGAKLYVRWHNKDLPPIGEDGFITFDNSEGKKKNNSNDSGWSCFTLGKGEDPINLYKKLLEIIALGPPTNKREQISLLYGKDETPTSLAFNGGDFDALKEVAKEVNKNQNEVDAGFWQNEAQPRKIKYLVTKDSILADAKALDTRIDEILNNAPQTDDKKEFLKYCRSVGMSPLAIDQMIKKDGDILNALIVDEVKPFLDAMFKEYTLKKDKPEQGLDL